MRPPADVPVLLIIFNRPDKTRQMISALREVKPRQVFVAADGPRSGVPDDVSRCASARRALENIDWECDVRTLFQDANLGCKRGPETAITWFFSQATEGVVLEDDCLPTPAFFPFCSELLERFRDDERIMMISGHNSLGSWSHSSSSYLCSRTSPTWGWATWRRAWRCYDPDMAAWTTAEVRSTVRARMPAAEFRTTRRWFDQVHAGKLDAWDFAWAFAMLRTGGLSVIPLHNMIANVGFGEDATHTKNPWSADARIPTADVTLPLVHPNPLRTCDHFEAALFEHQFPLRRRILTMMPQGVSDLIRSVVYSGISRVRGGFG